MEGGGGGEIRPARAPYRVGVQGGQGRWLKGKGFSGCVCMISFDELCLVSLI